MRIKIIRRLTKNGKLGEYFDAFESIESFESRVNKFLQETSDVVSVSLFGRRSILIVYKTDDEKSQ